MKNKLKANKLSPPNDPRYAGAQVERAGIFKCDASGNAFAGVIWVLTSGAKVFELVHGLVGDEEDPGTVLKLTRTKCVGSYIPGTDKAWNNYFQQRNSAAARKLWATGWRLL